MEQAARDRFEYVINRVRKEYEILSFDPCWVMSGNMYDYVPLLASLPNKNHLAVSVSPAGENILIMCGSTENAVIIDRDNDLFVLIHTTDGENKCAEITTIDQLNLIIH